MALGPELVYLQAAEIAESLASRRVKRIEAGDRWIAVSMLKDDALFFSWDPEWYGACVAYAGEVRELLAASESRPPIADALKAHLVGAELIEASAVGRDRVLMLRFSRAVGAGVKSERTLALEASGRYSNASLIGADGRVIESAKHIMPDVNRYRTTAPGMTYTLPPAAGSVMLDLFDERSPRARDELHEVTGVGRPLIKALLDGGASLEGLSIFKRKSGSVVFQRIGNYATAYSTPLPGAEAIRADSALCAARGVTVLPLISRYAEGVRRRIATAIEKDADAASRKIREAEASIADTSRAEAYMKEGRLILSNAHAIPRGASSAEVVDWTDDGEQVVTLSLDPALDAAANAEKRFVKYKKLLAARERAVKVLPSLYATRDELAEQAALLACHSSITTLLAMLPESERRARGSKRSATLPPHIRYEDAGTGCSIYCGLSARGNHYVTFRIARADDLWFHAQGIPGAHVILRFSTEPDEDAFDRAVAIASSCASRYSRAKGERIAIDFTERRYVRAIPGGGGARVTYKEFSTSMASGGLWSSLQDV